MALYLDEEARTKCRAREFSPDALWHSDSELTVYFKSTPEVPSEGGGSPSGTGRSGIRVSPRCCG